MNCPLNNGFELRRNPRIQVPDGNRNLVEDRLMKHWSAVPIEGTLPGCHFIKDKTKGKNICACIYLLTTYLLWRHVRCGANSCAGAGQGQKWIAFSRGRRLH